MTVIDVALEVIDDNPYNPRKHYPQAKVKEMAQSLRENGLRQIPEGRHVDGRVQLAYGHMRKRGYLYNQKHAPENEKWKRMPVDVKEISDQDMFHFSMAENLTRTDITPIEVARCFENYFVLFPSATETELAKKHNMTQGNISHMRRVLRLPEQVLEKINEGRINFTMGRELLVFADLGNAKDLMLEAIRELRSESKQYGEPCTVEGMQKGIHSVARRHLKALDKGMGWYSSEPLFDTREAGCLECPKMIRTHPTKSQTNHWCINSECWDKKQQEHKDKQAALAREKMREDVLRKVIEVETKREASEDITQVITQAEQPSEGLLTEEQAEALEEAIVTQDEEEKRRVEKVAELPADYPCHGCLNVKRCDRTTVVAVEGGRFTCENQLTKETAQALKEKVTLDLPPELQKLAQEKAGTRAEVLDLNGLWLDNWQRQLKQGYELLSHSIDQILDPDECLERCTSGFHYAFDSRRTTGEVMYVCTNTKCLSQKKAAFTRAKNAEGQARKKAEMKAIKEAVAATTTLDRPRIKLILLAQMDGLHASRTYYYGAEGGTKKPEKWLWDKVSAGTPENDRSKEKLFKAIDKLPDEELAKLVVEFMFYYLTDKGDLGTYEIKTTEPLNWMGVKIELPEGTAVVEEEVGSG